MVWHKTPDVTPGWNAVCDAALDGEPSRELQRRINISARRRSGAFFTGSKLAVRLISKRTNLGDKMPVFFDAACGAGDLLIAAAKLLPIKRRLHDTLRLWGKHLTGCDKHKEFVRATRARLALLAIRRGAKFSGKKRVSLGKLLPEIKVGNGLRCRKPYSKASCIILNPPFSKVRVPKDSTWARGRVTSAALFLEKALRHSKPDSKIFAILPDVLRSGSRYEKWRIMISKASKIQKVRVFGLFDNSADVDVFLLQLLRGEFESQSVKSGWVSNSPKSTYTISDFFEIHVGPVVPHRHEEKGKFAPFIHARSVPPWKRLSNPTEKRRFSGTLYKPSFVVIRRTSRPGDWHRATATIIAFAEPVAVENHLIICLPKDKKISTCVKLMRQLKTSTIDSNLNDVIRCRHLTVSSVSGLPFSV